jgi:hypothetical protein
MRPLRRKTLFLGSGAFVAIVRVVISLGLESSAATPPIYYVDGARPTANGVVTEDLAGCVQWSADRPDVHICGPVPANYSPAPTPYHDDKICSSAEQWLAAKRGELASAGCGAQKLDSCGN